MQLLLIGSPADRARLRAMLRDDLHVVGEASSIGEAREAGIDADAWLVAPAGRTAAAGVEPLTPREREVLELVADGLSNKAIADRLDISDQTVKFHVASICGKLGAANRTEAVRLALGRGLLAI
jgi:two-component system, NarL family, nitrate/nitrite response regulator NarL